MHREDELYSAESVLHQIDILFSEPREESLNKKRKSKEMTDADEEHLKRGFGKKINASPSKKRDN